MFTIINFGLSWAAFGDACFFSSSLNSKLYQVGLQLECLILLCFAMPAFNFYTLTFARKNKI